MVLFRRFFVLQLLLVWQGGFLFYTAFVVPTGGDVLGSAAAQGVITARVTDWLNVLGVITLLTMAWDQNYTPDSSDRRLAARWWCWGVALVCQLLLLFLHQVLDTFMDADRTRVVIREWFYPTHRIYLWTSTVLWTACLAWVWLAVAAWRAEDRGSGNANRL